MRITAPERSQRGLTVALLALLAPHALLALLFSALTLFALSLLSACTAPRGTIGAVIAQDEQSGRLFVREVPAGLAAAKAGIEAGDEILLIDGLDVRALKPAQIHAALSGEVDATVKLTLVRGEQVLRVTLKRTEARKLLKSRP
jgi:C-terminal processing protease CtpA/Prc